MEKFSMSSSFIKGTIPSLFGMVRQMDIQWLEMET